MHRITPMLYCSLVLFAGLILLSFAVPARAGHGHDRPKKTGILLVAFGTSVPEAQPALKNVEKLARAACPGVEVRWAYTSHIIRTILAKRGAPVDSPAMALSRMAEDGFTHVAVQSLHTLPGVEYHALLRTAKAFEGMPKAMERVTVGLPLLGTVEDFERVADGLLAAAPKDRAPGDALVYMGHGTHHPGNAVYPALQYYMWERDPYAFVGTVEGSPELDDLMPKLKARHAKTVYLTPAMAVAGDHARNDMCGEEPDSWKSILAKAGYDVRCVLTGTASVDAIAAIWVDHLKAAIGELH